MIRGLTNVPLPTWRDWLFSVKTFAASMLALYIALSAGLSRPYWAMATVYIVANPLSGATRSKAIFRLCGTVIGASAALFFLPPLVNSPVLFSAVIAIWTGTFLFISFTDRSPRSYMFMLSGYTLPLIALPAVGSPDLIFDIATARAQEICLGIICASLIHSLVLPGRVGPIVGGRVTAWLGDARGWLVDILTGKGGASTAERTGALVSGMTALDALISQLAYDPAMRVIVRHAHALRLRMPIFLPLASSLADRLSTIRQSGPMPPELEAIAADLGALLETSTIDADGCQSGDRALRAQDLRERIAALASQDTVLGDWRSIVIASAFERMRDILDLWQDCTTLEAEIRADHRARQRAELILPDVVAVAPHFDWPVLIFSAVSVMGASFVAGLIWIYTGWSDGAAFVMIATVACSFFATADAPAPMIRQFIILSVVSSIGADVYIFAILPSVHTFVGLILVLLGPFLLLGLLITRPQTMMIGMLVGVTMATQMSLQEVYSADFEAFANGAIATAAGGFYALIWMSVTRPFGAAAMARRLVRAGWRQIADAADGRMGTTPHLFTGRVFDRLGQLVPRLASGRALGNGPEEILTEMRVGLNVINLLGTLQDSSTALETALRLVLDGVRDFYEGQADAGRRRIANEALREHIDAALAIVLYESRLNPAGAEATEKLTDAAIRREVLSALVGLRLGLYPDAQPPTHFDDATPPGAQPNLFIAAQ